MGEDVNFSDLPIECSEGDRVQQVKQRFLVYWTYEALDERDHSVAADWQYYMSQCIDSPGFLDSDNIALMVDQMDAGIGEGRLAHEVLSGAANSDDAPVSLITDCIE